MENQQSLELYYNVINTDRSIGARLSGEIAKRYGNLGVATSPIKVVLNGTAGNRSESGTQVVLSCISPVMPTTMSVKAWQAAKL